MLSVATLKSASQASNYYESMDYYTQEEKQNNSCWFGVGAKNLNLDGAVDHTLADNYLIFILFDVNIRSWSSMITASISFI